MILLVGGTERPGDQIRALNTWLQAFCKQRGFHPMSAAVAWVGAHPAITAPIIGARSTEQLQASLDSVKIPMTP